MFHAEHVKAANGRTNEPFISIAILFTHLFSRSHSSLSAGLPGPCLSMPSMQPTHAKLPTQHVRASHTRAPSLFAWGTLRRCIIHTYIRTYIIWGAVPSCKPFPSHGWIRKQRRGISSFQHPVWAIIYLNRRLNTRPLHDTILCESWSSGKKAHLLVGLVLHLQRPVMANSNTYVLSSTASYIEQAKLLFPLFLVEGSCAQLNPSLIHMNKYIIARSSQIHRAQGRWEGGGGVPGLINLPTTF